MLRLPPDDLRTLLMAGVAAGFGSVFGTPIAGAIFAMEVLAIGRMQYGALIPVRDPLNKNASGAAIQFPDNKIPASRINAFCEISLRGRSS